MERYEDVAESAAERLLEHSWERRARRASQRELLVDAVAAALFAAVAVALLLADGGIRPHAGQVGLLSGTGALLIAVYALVARIEFPVGAARPPPSSASTTP